MSADVAAVLITVGMVFLTGGLWQIRERELVKNTTPSKVRSLAMGTVEVEGEVVPADETLWSSLTEEYCVAYEYSVEEKILGTDQWRILEGGKERVPFYIDDGTGRVLVDPEGAEILYTESRYVESDELREPISEDEPVSKQVWENVIESNRPRRYTESYLPVGEHVYVFGEATEREERSSKNEENIVVERGTAPTFTVSEKQEDELKEFRNNKARNLILTGIAQILVGFLFLLDVIQFS